MDTIFDLDLSTNEAGSEADPVGDLEEPRKDPEAVVGSAGTETPKKVPRLISCYVQTCSNTNHLGKEGLLFFSFPVDPVRFQKWASLIGEPDLKYNPCLRICSDHFAETEYTLDLSKSIPELYDPNRRRKLTKKALPSLLLPQTAPSNGIFSSFENEDSVCLNVVVFGDDHDASEESSRLQSSQGTLDDNNASSQVPAGLTVATTHIPQVSEPCLVCSASDVRINLQLHEIKGSQKSNALNQQLWCTFVLMNLLKLPHWKYEDILRKVGSSINPSDWFVICTNCTESVNTILRIQDEIANLEDKLRNLKKSFKRKCHDNILSIDTDDRSVGRDGIFDIRKEIRTCLKDPSYVSNVEIKTEDSDAEGSHNATAYAITSDLYLDAASERGTIYFDSDNDGSHEVQSVTSNDVHHEDHEEDGDRIDDTDGGSDTEWLPAPSTRRSPKKKAKTKPLPEKDPRNVNDHCIEDEDCYESDSSYDPNTDREDNNTARKQDILEDSGVKYKIWKQLVYECNLCPRRYNKKNLFERHKRRHEQSTETYQGRLDCLECKAPYDSIKSLRWHLRAMHSLTLDKNWDEHSPQGDHVTKLIHNVNTKNLAVANKEGSGSNTSTYTCSKCNREFKDLSQFEAHKKLHEETPDDLHCSECQRPHTNKESLQKHLRYVHKISEFKCTKCGMDAMTQTSLKNHMIKHLIYDDSVDPSISTTHFVCTICKELFKTRKKLSLHRVGQHCDELGIPVFKCTEGECTSKFLRKSGLVEHVATHHKRVVNYQCDQCGYGAVTKYKLQSHQQSHRETPYVCAYCPQTYAHKTGIRDHIKKVHPEHFDAQRKSYFDGVDVPKLEKEFGPKELLLGTVGVPEKQKKWPCKYCSSVFEQKYELNHHLRSGHKDMYAHNCDLCDRTYMSEQSLKLHLKINHVEQSATATCGWCNKTYSHRIKLYDHSKRCVKRPKGDVVPKIFVLEDGDNQVKGKRRKTIQETYNDPDPDDSSSSMF